MQLRPRVRAGALVAFACGLAAITVPAGASTAVGAPRSATHTMIVFFKHPGASPRGSLAREAFAAGLEAVGTLGGRVLTRESRLDAATVQVTSAEAAALSRDPDIASVFPNGLVPAPAVPHVALRSVAPRSTPSSGPCGTAATPELDPEALASIDATGAAATTYDGAGVKVAFLADGVDPDDVDLQRNAAFASAGSPAGSPVISSYEDFSGDGPGATTDGAEAFGDAGSIAAQGNTVYDLSGYVNKAHPLPKGCDITVQGDAPGASLVALKVFGDTYSYVSSAVEAINYAIADGVSVINESFGTFNFPDTAADVIREANDEAVAAGVTVVVSSGDAGPSSTIGSPASDPAVLAVGATTTFRAYAQLTYGGINALGSAPGYVDNGISALSSGGFAQSGKTVNLVAPGDLNWDLCSSSTTFEGCGKQSLQLFGGTSESAPLTAGAAADVIEAYRATHGGASPSPALVANVLTSSATDLAAPSDLQGAGLLDVDAAIGLAESLPGTTAASVPGGVLSDTSQVNLEGQPASEQGATVDLTNTSATTATVAVSTRALVAAKTTSGKLVLNTAKSSKQPTFVDTDGLTNVFQKATFSVPAGTATVSVSATFGSEHPSLAGVQVALFNPSRDFAGYSLPEGWANYAIVQASHPEPGTWTAVFFSVRTSEAFENSSGPIYWSATSFAPRSQGSLSTNSLVLAPGQTAPVQLEVALPSTPGDSSYAVVVSSGAQHTTIPVTLRTVVPVTASGATFHGVLAGGDGREGAPAQTATYTFDVPGAERDLDVGVALAANVLTKAFKGNELDAVLVDPDGDAQAFGSNLVLGAKNAYEYSKYVNVYLAQPAAGEWQLDLIWDQPLNGVALTTAFTASIQFDAVSIHGDLPDSASATVPKAGASYAVTIDNKGVAPLYVTPDPRLDGTVTLASTGDGGALQGVPGAYNDYFVPPATASVTFAQVTTIPASFAAGFDGGDPLLAPGVPAPYTTSTSSSESSSLTYAPPDGLTAGLWFLATDGIGPYNEGAPGGGAVLAVHVVTRPFDGAVTSKYGGDIQELLEGTSTFTKPLEVKPGVTASLPITIDPTASTGTVVQGTLFVDNVFSEFVVPSIAAIPYEYTVGS